jgi:nucleoside 2-deoxyribosyltransferase
MNIYTATKWERRKDQYVRNRQIEAQGHTITHDWTVWEERNPSSDVPSRRHSAAMLDYAGVMQADLLIFWDHPQANGARWECGMAVTLGIPIWIVEYQNVVVFDALPQVSIVSDWEEALNALRALV